jgi:TPR repeat protein
MKPAHDMQKSQERREDMPRFGTAQNNNVPQDRFNHEMFRALELLGHKLERVEKERDRLARRLEQIEAAANIDEATGRLYLPAVVEPPAPPHALERHALRWSVGAGLTSSVLALCALGIVLFRAPQTGLTPEQLTALNTLGSLQLALMDHQAAPASAAKAPVTTAAARQAIQKPALQKDAETLAAVQPAAGDDAVSAKPVQPAAATPVNTSLGSHDADGDVPMPPQPVAAAAPLSVPSPVPPIVAQAVAEMMAKPVIAATTPAPEAQAALPSVKEAAKETGQAVLNPVGNRAADPALPANLRTLEKRALDGLPEAQHDLGTIYAAGTLVPQDYARAATWFRRAADAGIANAAYNLGVMCQQGLGVPKDARAAIGWYEKAAQKGHPEALYNLGIVYTKGLGADVDMDKGVAYFKRAANAGVAQAAYNLGVLYEGNLLGAPSPSRALEWYGVAANQGHAEAKTAMARLQAQGFAAGHQDLTETAATSAAAAAEKAAAVEPAAGDPDDADSSAGSLTPGERRITAPSIAPVDR